MLRMIELCRFAIGSVFLAQGATISDSLSVKKRSVVYIHDCYRKTFLLVIAKALETLPKGDRLKFSHNGCESDEKLDGTEEGQ
jgi:hypothetical protein